MFKRTSLQFVTLLSLLAVGAVAIKLVGEIAPVKSHNLWEALTALPAEAAGTIYVDASVSGGAGTGSSWPDAYLKLQDALSAAASGDQIWVAAGVYYPDEGGGMTNDDRTMTFPLFHGVELYGGFAGDETMLSQRNWETNVTVLSGDIDKNDMTDSNEVVTVATNIVGNNAYHVVTGGEPHGSAVLDGFTVTAGQANGTLPDNNGGGMFIWTTHPTVTNVNFIGNQGVYGGGMSNNSNSNPTLTNVSFTANHAVSGGGMYNYANSSPTLTNVSFIGNQGVYGGGMNTLSFSHPTLTNVSFRGNLADYGGGMFSDDSFSQLTNVSFSGNKATLFGGGMYSYISLPSLTNAIFWNNQAGTSGHQIYNDSTTPVISYSDIQGSGGSSSWDTALGSDGGNNIDADPLFVTPVDPGTAPTTAGDLHLQYGSPAVDTGYNGFCPLTDLDGNTRPIDGNLDGSADCDIGAYEKLLDLFLPLIMR